MGENMMTREPLANDTAQEIVTTDNDNFELVSSGLRLSNGFNVSFHELFI